MSELKIGAVYYNAWVDDDGKVEIDTAILRTIRGKYGYLVVKNRWTWVKTGFGQNATWGWAGTIDPLYREKFRLDSGIPEVFARSPSQAVRARLRWIKRTNAEYPETDPDMIAYDEMSIAALERRLKHEMRKKARRVNPKVTRAAA